MTARAILGASVRLWRVAPLRWSALAALLAIHVVLSLEPFDWRIPGRMANGATPLADGWAFATAGILIAETPPDGFAGATLAETLDVSLEIRPHAASGSGAARILTIAQDAYRRFLTLSQEGDDLVLGLRGEDGGRRRWETERLEGVLATGRWVAIEVRLRPGRLTIAIDGVPQLWAVLPPRVLGAWDAGPNLALGNAVTCDRPWLGDIRRAVIAGPDGAVDYVRAGRIEAPAGCTVLRHPPKLVPLVRLNRHDALLNTLMYVPLGGLLGMMAHRRNRQSFAVLLLALVGVSLTLETLQLLVPSRFPSIDDVLFNAAGGALGLGVGFWLMARLAAWLPEARA